MAKVYLLGDQIMGCIYWGGVMFVCHIWEHAPLVQKNPFLVQNLLSHNVSCFQKIREIGQMVFSLCTSREKCQDFGKGFKLSRVLSTSF